MKISGIKISFLIKLQSRILLCILTLTLCLPAAADDFHYVNTIIGNRAAGLAGAYTALSDDPAGCYYNPAGIAFASNLSLSASVNAYGTHIKKYKAALSKTNGITLDWEQISENLLPNFFGIVRKIGQGSVGFSFVVSDSTQIRQKQYFNDIASTYADNDIASYMININDIDKTYLFGPTYAYPFSDSFSIGATLYWYYKDREIIRNQVLQFEQGQHYLMNYYETKIDQGIRPIIGIMYEPIDKLAIGFSVSKILLLSNDTQQHDIFRNTISENPVVIDSLEYDFSDTDTLYFKNANSDEKDDLPLTIALGFSYFVSSKFLFTADVIYYQETDDKENVLNLSFGTEYYIKEFLALRCGVFTDNANTAELSSTDINQQEHIDILGINLSFTLFQKVSCLTLGMSYGFGNGQSQIITDSIQLQDAEIQNITAYLSASYSY